MELEATFSMYRRRMAILNTQVGHIQYALHDTPHILDMLGLPTTRTLIPILYSVVKLHQRNCLISDIINLKHITWPQTSRVSFANQCIKYQTTSTKENLRYKDQQVQFASE